MFAYEEFATTSAIVKISPRRENMHVKDLDMGSVSASVYTEKS